MLSTLVHTYYIISSEYCYSRCMQPLLLVLCKNPSESLRVQTPFGLLRKWASVTWNVDSYLLIALISMNEKEWTKLRPHKSYQQEKIKTFHWSKYLNNTCAQDQCRQDNLTVSVVTFIWWSLLSGMLYYIDANQQKTITVKLAIHDKI